MLLMIPDNTIKTSFFDPQYRGVLDKLNYGNEGKQRGKQRCDLPQMSEETIIDFVRELNRVTVKSGHLFLWVDKFPLFGLKKSLKSILTANLLNCKKD